MSWSKTFDEREYQVNNWLRWASTLRLGGVSLTCELETKTMEFQAGVTQLVECDLAKVDVAGSNPVSRSTPLPVRPGDMGNRMYLRHR
jgi:hypothetical protein